MGEELGLMEGKSPESRTTEGTWDGNELFPHQLKQLMKLTHFPPSKRVNDGRQASCGSAVKEPETKPVPAVSAVEK